MWHVTIGIVHKKALGGGRIDGVVVIGDGGGQQRANQGEEGEACHQHGHPQQQGIRSCE